MTGYKEWSLVCDALAAGRQSILLRKGGISEGGAGFAFDHGRFVFLPTAFHQQAAQVRIPGVPLCPAGVVGGFWHIQLSAEVAHRSELRDWGRILALEPFHAWKTDVVRKRYEDRNGGMLHFALVRVFRIQPEWKLLDMPDYGGCRSWVELPDLPEGSVLEPVLADEEFEKLKQDILEIVS